MLFKDITIINEDFTTTRNVCVGIREGKYIGGFTEGFGEEFDGRVIFLPPPSAPPIPTPP